MLETIRCPRCHLMLMKVEGKAEVKCRKCKSIISIDTKAKKKAAVLA